MEVINHQLMMMKDLWTLKEIKCPINMPNNNNKEEMGKFRL